jgi:hypothetical protein
MRDNDEEQTDYILWTMFGPRQIIDFPIRHIHMIRGLRHVAISQLHGRDPLDDLAVRYKSVAAAALVVDMLQTATHAWPDKFLLMRPCCRITTPDEAAIGTILSCAEAADRESAHVALGTLLPCDAVDALFNLCVHFADNLDPKIFAL